MKTTIQEFEIKPTEVVQGNNGKFETIETDETTTLRVITPHNDCGCSCIICPNCGAHELDHKWKPKTQEEKENYPMGKWNIRAFKVDNWSHCLECDCWFDMDGNIELPEKKE